MGVYIKDMKMPKGCLLCRFFDPIHMVCLGMERAEKTILSDKYKHPACPLIEVPKHGRLIDADALLESIKEAKKKQPEISDVYDEDYFSVAEWVAYAPTIIPAEEGE